MFKYLSTYGYGFLQIKQERPDEPLPVVRVRSIEELTWLDADPVQHQPPATPPRRTPSVSPPSIPPNVIVFGQERLGCRVPTFDEKYNLVSLNNHELAVALQLPPNGTAAIVVALDATPAHSQGQEKLHSAHFAYANGAIPGTN